MKTAPLFRLTISALLGSLLVAATSQAATGPQASAKPKMNLAAAQTAHLAALKQAQTGDVKGAIRALQVLSLQSMPAGERDRVFLSLGRLDYEIGLFDNAIAAYNHVSKTGRSWLEALEEIAWAQFREGHPQETIAKLKTVTNAVFKDDTKSEPFFLMGLAQLRVCDFKAVFKTIDLFKSRFGGTTKALEASTAPKDQARLKEIGETVQKLNLVEAETIQRLYVDENGKKRKGSAPSIARGSDELSFPTTDDDEFWLDEVDGYKVSLKGCLPPPAPKKLVSSATQNGMVK